MGERAYRVDDKDGDLVVLDDFGYHLDCIRRSQHSYKM
jgi:hypothetical protein